jgi:hypothetical protein
MIYSGTYFGTRAEFNLLNIEVQLGSGPSIEVDIIDSWLGTVLNWAEEEVVQLVGGIVSTSKVVPIKFSHLVLIARPFLREES